MNIDGHQFNFPDNTKTGIPKIEKIAPGKNSLEQKTSKENIRHYQDAKKTIPNRNESTPKTPEELKKEINEIEGKGTKHDVVT